MSVISNNNDNIWYGNNDEDDISSVGGVLYLCNISMVSHFLIVRRPGDIDHMLFNIDNGICSFFVGVVVVQGLGVANHIYKQSVQ